MNTEVFDPNAISITEPAMAHLRERLRESKAAGLRLGVSEKGCNGFMYELDLVHEEPKDQWRLGNSDELRIFVKPEDLKVLRGTTIDFVTEGLNSALMFRNPNADTLCGCGESFSLRGT